MRPICRPVRDQTGGKTMANTQAPAPVVTTGVPVTPVRTAAIQPAANTPARNVPSSAANPTTFVRTPAAASGGGTAPTPTNGGGFLDDVKDGAQALVKFAQGKMNSLDASIKQLLNSEGGDMDGQKLRALTGEMEDYRNMMQLAAKMDENKQRAIQVWLQ